MANDALLKVEDVSKEFTSEGALSIRSEGKVLRAVDHVTFEIQESETLGILGESGCGKTTLGRTVLLLTRPTSGQIELLGKDLTKLSVTDLRKMRRHMGIVFQDPIASLDPRMRVQDIIAEPLEIQEYHKDEIEELIQQAGRQVNLSDREMNRFPHQLSGGQRQRVGIARAIISRPQFVVLDEPTSSLDVSVQAQILNLLLETQAQLKLSFLFISHNIDVIRYMSDRVGVMYLGRIVEIGSAKGVIGRPFHPYTMLLIDSVPRYSKRAEFQQKAPNRDELETRMDWISECAFQRRCPYAQARCRTEEPQLREVEEGHFVACHFAPIT